MYRIMIAIISLGIFILLLSLINIKINLHYRRQGTDDNLLLELSIWRRLIYYKIELPVLKTGLRSRFRPRRRHALLRMLRPAYKIEAEVTGKNGLLPAKKIKEVEVFGVKRIISMIKKGKIFLRKYMPTIRYLLGKLYLRHFLWSTEIGMEEPHVTGFLAGLTGGVKGLLLSKLYHVIHPGAERPTVVITPNFEKPCFKTRIDCEIDVKIGYIILTCLKFTLKGLRN